MKLKTETIQSTLDSNYVLHEICTTERKTKVYVITYEEQEVRIRKTNGNNEVTFVNEVMTSRKATHIVKKYNKLFNTDKFGKKEI